MIVGHHILRLQVSFYRSVTENNFQGCFRYPKKKIKKTNASPLIFPRTVFVGSTSFICLVESLANLLIDDPSKCLTNVQFDKCVKGPALRTVYEIGDQMEAQEISFWLEGW